MDKTDIAQFAFCIYDHTIPTRHSIRWYQNRYYRNAFDEAGDQAYRKDHDLEAHCTVCYLGCLVLLLQVR
jgi:hypothetical protein